MQNKFIHAKKLLSDGIAYGLVNAFNKGLSFLLFPFITRLLTTEEVGILGIVASVASLFTIVTMFSMDSAAARFFFDDDDESKRNRVIASAFWLQLFCFIFVLPVLTFVSLVFLSFKQHAAIVLIYLGSIVFLNVIHGFGIGVARIRRYPAGVALISLSNSIVLMILLLVLVIAGKKGVAGYFSATILAFVVSSIISLLTLRRRINIRFFRKGLSRKMLAYVWPIVPGTIAVWFVENSGILFAGFIGTTKSAGIYKVGYTLSQIVVLVIFAFQQAWGPYAISVHREEGARGFFALVFRMYLLATVVLGTFLSLFAAEMLRLLFPPQYASANRIVLLLTFGHILAGLYFIGIMGLVIAKNMKPYGMVTMAVAAMTLLGNVVLTKIVGDTGPALVYFLAKYSPFWRSSIFRRGSTRSRTISRWASSCSHQECWFHYWGIPPFLSPLVCGRAWGSSSCLFCLSEC
jgi:O-antigen/teichoic acid export membrane protein